MIQEAEHWRTIDGQGRVMPWYTRGCCKWLETLDLNGKNVWEWGGGESTLWYRSAGAHVLGVDSDRHWAYHSGLDFVNDMVTYIFSINGSFDLICIDGDVRDHCFREAINHLKYDGVIIIDNYKQTSAGWPNWPITEGLIKELNLKVTEYHELTHPDWLTITVQR